MVIVLPIALLRLRRSPRVASWLASRLWRLVLIMQGAVGVALLVHRLCGIRVARNAREPARGDISSNHDQGIKVVECCRRKESCKQQQK